jgi:DNA-binding response OmpR family regulator
MNTKTALRILVIEDHVALRQTLAQLFETHGHQADFAADGRTGLHLALRDLPDVIILDVGLPGIDGLQVCEQLRQQADRHIPILMLTARDALSDKLAGFAIGADDYLLKPFANEELLARCVALSKRHRVGTQHRLVLGSLSIDRQAGQAHRFDQVLSLQRIPYQILLALAEAWPRAVSRSALIDKLWPESVPQSDPLRSHLYALRLALDKPFQKPMLITIHGVGFRLESDA